MEIVELYVRMCCHGCERTVRKALSHVKRIDSIEIDLELQKVTVTGYVDRKKVLKAVRKTGKQAEFWAQQLLPNHMRSQKGNGYFRSQPYARTYNYEKHGYNDNNGFTDGQFQSLDAPTIFSDENPASCSVM
eukprot:c21657_g1_i1 orf=111-506(+)